MFKNTQCVHLHLVSVNIKINSIYLNHWSVIIYTCRYQDANQDLLKAIHVLIFKSQFAWLWLQVISQGTCSIAIVKMIFTNFHYILKSQLQWLPNLSQFKMYKVDVIDYISLNKCKVIKYNQCSLYFHLSLPSFL